ncbi:MAG: restriction endonuclease subunit S [Senegalia sp. (in: firmicutes)]|uniref:restriction endonuclease subunit S n=1 Tax=Senegalia sp. (in: firmicutes) TaxID=1924098 RepID=UPI003F94CF5C
MIFNLLEERTNFSLHSKNEDAWIEELLSKNPNDIHFITTEMLFKRTLRKFHSLKNYNVKGIFDLSSPFVETRTNFTLYVLTKHKVKELKVGQYLKPLTPNKNDRNLESEEDKLGKMNMFLNYPKEYIDYCDAIANYIMTDDFPVDTSFYNFHKVPYSEFNYEKPFAKIYSKNYYNILEIINKEKTELLGKYADIIIPKKSSNSMGYVLLPKDFKYPINYNDLSKKEASDIKIKKGDIISAMRGLNKLYLVYEEPNVPIYASHNSIIIRPKNISPEYLLSYLESETSQLFIDANSFGSVFKTLSIETIKSIPIIIPKGDNTKYNKLFRIKYFKPDSIDIYNDFFSNVSINKEIVDGEDLLNTEILGNVRFYKQEALYDFIKEDFVEINSCFNAKAYKATLILAGSVLEAFLIDWLSEINNINYFNQDYRIKDNRGKFKNATLYNFIDEIKYINKPDWMEGAYKSHNIRKKRNLVHAKLCIKSDEINKETCLQVIDYLKDVIKTRIDVNL